MRRLTDGDRDLIREAEADARACEEGRARAAGRTECAACGGTGWQDAYDIDPGGSCPCCEGIGWSLEPLRRDADDLPPW